MAATRRGYFYTLRTEEVVKVTLNFKSFSTGKSKRSVFHLTLPVAIDEVDRRFAPAGARSRGAAMTTTVLRRRRRLGAGFFPGSFEMKGELLGFKTEVGEIHFGAMMP